MTESACLQELTHLENMENYLKQLVGGGSGFRGSSGGWSYLKVGKSWFYEKTVVYTGSEENHDIDFPVSVQLNRIEQVWNDATARDISVRVFTDPSLSYYVELRQSVSNTLLNQIIQVGAEYKYPAGSRLRMNYQNTTGAKTVTIRVQVDEV